MLDLDSLDLPPGSRLGLIGTIGEYEHHDLKPGTWTCTLLNLSRARGVHPLYSLGTGTTASIAFARAKSSWLTQTTQLKEPRLPKTLTKLSLDDLDL